MKNLSEQIGRRLRAARIAAGYKSATALSQEKMIPMSTYSQHESGKRVMSADVLVFYSELFGVNSGWLLSGEGAPFPRGVEDSVTRAAVLNDHLYEFELTGAKEIVKNDLSPLKSSGVSQVNEDLLSEVLLRLVPVLRTYELTISDADVVEFAFEVYNGVVTTSANLEDKLAMVDLSIASLKRGAVLRSASENRKTA